MTHSLKIIKPNGQITKEGPFVSFESANARGLKLNKMGYDVEIVFGTDSVAELNVNKSGGIMTISVEFDGR